MAERIIELALEHGVHIHRDAALVDALSHLDLGQEIPPQLYQVVAAVLAFVYRLDAQAGKESASTAKDVMPGKT